MMQLLLILSIYAVLAVPMLHDYELAEKLALKASTLSWAELQPLLESDPKFLADRVIYGAAGGQNFAVIEKLAKDPKYAISADTLFNTFSRSTSSAPLCQGYELFIKTQLKSNKRAFDAEGFMSHGNAFMKPLYDRNECATIAKANRLTGLKPNSCSNAIGAQLTAVKYGGRVSYEFNLLNCRNPSRGSVQPSRQTPQSPTGSNPAYHSVPTQQNAHSNGGASMNGNMPRHDLRNSAKSPIVYAQPIARQSFFQSMQNKASRFWNNAKAKFTPSSYAKQPAAAQAPVTRRDRAQPSAPVFFYDPK
jgi:hypothetical protein